MVLHLKVGEQGHYHFQSLSASFAVTPGPEVSQHHNVYWFDPTNMKPMINSPGHVKALEFLLDLHKTGPQAQVGWALGEAWDYFLRGKAVFVFSWATSARSARTPPARRSRATARPAILPASEEYYDHATGEFVKTDNPAAVGNTTGGSWHGVVSAFSANPEATFSFWSPHGDEGGVALELAVRLDGGGPGLQLPVPEPLGEATVEEYVAAGWDAEDVKTYTQAYYENFYADTILTYLRIPGTFEYWDILDKNLSATMSGELTPQEALDRTAETWEGHHRAARPRLAAPQVLPGRHRLRRLIPGPCTVRGGGPRPPGHRGRRRSRGGGFTRTRPRPASRPRAVTEPQPCAGRAGRDSSFWPAVVWVLAFTVFPLGYSLYIAFLKIENKTEITRERCRCSTRKATR